MAANRAAGQLRKGITAALASIGHAVSANVNDWPRVELTDVTEDTSVDKGEDVRELGFVIEAISNLNYGEASDIMTDIETALIGTDTITMTSFKSLDIYRELASEINEVGDADLLIIRLRTQFRAIIAEK